MALIKPVLSSVAAFDATKSMTFNFIANGGDPFVGSKLTVKLNDTGVVVYSSTIYSTSPRYVLPANSLSNGNYYVDTAIHKAIIELNEKGTKAAAITYFGIAGNALQRDEFEVKKIVFDKPFVYMIREAKSGEILFFGSVYEPNEWQGSTCDKLM